MSRALLAAAAIGAAVAAPLPAAATCMTSCTAELIFDDCNYPAEPTVWPAAETLTLAGTCETCCSPPGGPVTCSPEPMTADMLELHAGGAPLNGLFSPLSVGCSPEPLFAWGGALSPGAYEVVAPSIGLILLQFEVKDAGCATEADCPPCNVCLDGVCKGLGVAICQTDGDCAEGETCLVNEAAPCANHCVPKDAQCTTNEDCGDCAGCLDGQCIPSGLIECKKDDDCPAGEVCEVDPIAACKNRCVDAGPGCTDDDECGPCAVCAEGECVATGNVMCEQDADCGPAYACVVHATDPCKNTCIPDAPGPCTGDEDCGACEACVDGECKGTGVVACTTDQDCGPFEQCIADAAAPCNNHCAPGETPDAGGTDAGGPDAGSVGEDTGAPGPDAATPSPDAGGIGLDTGAPAADTVGGSPADPDATGGADVSVPYGDDALDGDDPDDGCAASPGAPAGTLALLLAAAALVAIRRRA